MNAFDTACKENGKRKREKTPLRMQFVRTAHVLTLALTPYFSIVVHTALDEPKHP